MRPGRINRTIIESLYGSHQCQKCDGVMHVRSAVSLDVLFEDLSRRVYEGSLTAGQLDELLHTSMMDELGRGYGEGYGIDLRNVNFGEPDHQVSAYIRQNLGVFSAAKNVSEVRQLTDLLLGPDGKVRPFEEFMADALQIHEKYNKAWLQTEYLHTVASAQMAAQWQRYMNNPLMTSLMYMTVGDDRVRPEHEVLDGIVKKKNDPWWDYWYPPNAWRCRCDAVETNNNETPSEQVSQRTNTQKLPSVFRTNVGKTGVVFKDSHPYFQDVKGKVSELEAVKNYGMRSVSRIYADVNKLPQESVMIFTEWWEDISRSYGFKDFVAIPDHSGLKVKLERELFKDSFHAVNAKDIIMNAHEVWHSESTQTYIKYFKDHTMIVTTNKKLKAISFKVLPGGSPEVEQHRIGALLKQL